MYIKTLKNQMKTCLIYRESKQYQSIFLKCLMWGRVFQSVSLGLWWRYLYTPWLVKYIWKWLDRKTLKMSLQCWGVDHVLPLFSGSTLITVGEFQRRLGGAEREFLHVSAINFLTPLRNFLEGDWKTISVSEIHNRSLRWFITSFWYVSQLTMADNG